MPDKKPSKCAPRKKRVVHSVDSAVIENNVDIVNNKAKYLFAIRFNELLEEREISQEQLANDIQISTGIVSKYRNGLSEPKLTAICQIAEYLEVSADYLMGLSDVKSVDDVDKEINRKFGFSDRAINSISAMKRLEDDNSSINTVVPINLIIEKLFNGLLYPKIAEVPNALAHASIQYSGRIKSDSQKEVTSKLLQEQDKFKKGILNEYRFRQWDIVTTFQEALVFLFRDILAEDIYLDGQKIDTSLFKDEYLKGGE